MNGLYDIFVTVLMFQASCHFPSLACDPPDVLVIHEVDSAGTNRYLYICFISHVIMFWSFVLVIFPEFTWSS